MFRNDEANEISTMNTIMELFDGVFHFRTTEASQEDTIKSTLVEKTPHDDVTREIFEEGSLSIASEIWRHN